MAGRTEPNLPRPIEYTEKKKINRGRELRRDNDAMDYLKFTRRMIEHFKRERGRMSKMLI